MSLTTSDRVEITELVSRYNQAIDSGDHETWASTFTADGTFNSKSGQASGTDELSKFAPIKTPEPINLVRQGVGHQVDRWGLPIHMRV